MKYSIIISPKLNNSNALNHALGFIRAILKCEAHQITVFFYGHAVKYAFEFDPIWQQISEQNVSLFACSTIAEGFFDQKLKVVDYMTLAGLGQWMESVFDANKNIEFR